MLKSEVSAVIPWQASREGRLKEIFGCGTACIVQPINALIRANGEVIASPFDADSETTMTARMTRALTDIQYARYIHSTFMSSTCMALKIKGLAGLNSVNSLGATCGFQHATLCVTSCAEYPVTGVCLLMMPRLSRKSCSELKHDGVFSTGGEWHYDNFMYSCAIVGVQ